MNTVRSIQRLNERELADGTPPSSSWHTDYRDTAFIYIGGLPFELSEGDVITIFSQYGEPVWIKMARDKETGKSRGFCWLKYEDQRSCDLAVDNLGGAKVMDRTLAVDHTRYKPRDDEDMRDNTMGELDEDEDADEDAGRHKRRRTDSQSESDEDRPMIKEELELQKLMGSLDDDDPMKASMVRKKQEDVDKALEKMKRNKRKEKERKDHSTRHHRDREAKKDRDHRRVKHIKDRPEHTESIRQRRSRSRDGQDGHQSSRRDRSREHDRRRTKRDLTSSPPPSKSTRQRSRSRSQGRSSKPVRSEDLKNRHRHSDRDRHRYSSDEEDYKYSKSKRLSRGSDTHSQDRRSPRHNRD